MNQKDKDVVFMSLLVAALLVVVLVFVKVVPSYFESRTYNRLTGARTTWWDAMWVELRVQEGVKP